MGPSSTWNMFVQYPEHEPSGGPKGARSAIIFSSRCFKSITNLCFDVLNKLEFPITIVCLRPISLNQRILQWTLSILIKNTLKNSMFEPTVFVTKMISKKFFFGVLNILTLPFFWCAFGLYSHIFSSDWFLFGVLNKLKFSITLVCLRPFSLNTRILH